MGGFGAGGGMQESSSASRPPPTTFLNPMGGVLANLFGIPTSIHEGGIMYGGGGFPFAPPTLGRDFGGSFGKNVADYFQMKNPFGDIAQLAGLDIGAGTESFIDTFYEDIMPGYTRLASTGDPVDVGALVQQTTRDVAEELSPRTGFYSSDLAAEALRQGSELQVGAEEAARGRQLTALALGPSVANIPSGVINEMLLLGENINLAATAPGRAVTALQLLAGLQPTGAISRGNISDAEGKGFDWNAEGAWL
jgi:hypothetical protein